MNRSLQPKGVFAMHNEIASLFRDTGHDDRALVTEIENLADRRGPSIYSQALRILAGLDLPAADAEKHWKAMLNHCRKFFPAKHECHLRAALVDYFHREARILRDPRILEAQDLEQVRRASITDGLTGLYHQGYFKARLEHQFNRKKRGPRDRFAIVLLDLDYFKQYNDYCGHLAGDDALRRVAEIIRLSIRDYDVAARYGGEEFALLLFRVAPRQALLIAERIRAMMEKTVFSGQEKMASGTLTISAGVATYPEDAQSPRELLAQADQRLYQAKQSRNRVVPSESDRRRVDRRKVRSIVEVAPCDGGYDQSYPGVTTDLSRQGLSVDCGVSFQPGSTVQVRFRKPFWNREAATEATVRRIRRDEESGIVHLGLEFRELGDTIEALTGSHAQDRRDEGMKSTGPSPA
jgi:diguanylate cyclase (GGDEF)-like protein